MNLEPGRAYFLNQMRPDMWTGPHPIFGTPERVAGKYIGSLQGNRRWHGFEVWKDGMECGVIFMTDDDLQQLDVSEIVGERE